MQGEVDAEGVASDFDLNSLIEGDVDDDDFGEQFVPTREEDSKTPVVTYFEPLKVRNLISEKYGNYGRIWKIVMDNTLLNCIS